MAITVVLNRGELGYDESTKTAKVGDGSTQWDSLQPFNTTQIEDNLTSTSTSAALSAKQGKVLKDSIDTLEDEIQDIVSVSVVDNLNTQDGTKSLSANQGYILNQTKLNISNVVDSLTSTSSTSALSARQGKVLNTSIESLQTQIDEIAPTLISIVDDLISEDTNKALSANQGKVLDEKKVNVSDIVNNLTSTSTSAPLSANQGKILKDNLDLKVPISSIVNNLTSGGTNVPLSAEQGKVLNNSVSSLQTQIDNIDDNIHDATQTSSGFMSAADKVKLDALKPEANLTLSSYNVTLQFDSIGKLITTYTVNVTYNGSGALSVESKDTSKAQVSLSNKVITINILAYKSTTIDVILNSDGVYDAEQATINIIASEESRKRYGIKIAKNESNPSSRVTYIYDAVGMTPAKMVSSTFDYGSWANLWFVTDNVPLMLKQNGTVDYYLDPNDYTKKLDGTSSDVSNSSYGSNAMARFPLVWVYRYEDSNYEYEIICPVQYDENYKAYAHIRADGSIAEYFYWSCFNASGTSSLLKSTKGQSPSAISAINSRSGAKGNGTIWDIHTWSQRELIRTLLTIMGKSTDTESVFGHGRTSGSSAIETGTLSNKGQFWGDISNTTNAMKVFHVENFWGSQWLWTAGLINNKGPIYVKMTPEGNGYQNDNVSGYNNTGITLSGTSGGYISSGKMSEFGFIPKVISGSETTYYADGSWFNNSQHHIAGSSCNHGRRRGFLYTDQTAVRSRSRACRQERCRQGSGRA